MIKTGLIGHPVVQSKSPMIHEYWMQQHGIAGTYKAIDIMPENLESSVRDLVNEGYTGFNVTVPHKEAIMALCDEIGEGACAIGAVNTVSIKDRRLIGSNTDEFGFIENMNGFDVRGKTVLVLGAGGAAKAAVYALKKSKSSRVILTNRTPEKAAAFEGVEVLAWQKKESILKDVDLFVNTTSLGMIGKPPLEIDIIGLRPDATVYDIVYAPLMTDLLKAAQAQGNPIITGIGMLLHQARPAFKKWHGVMPEVSGELQELVLS